MIVTFLVTLFVAFNVTAGVYTHFQYESDGNRKVCFDSSTTSSTDQIQSYYWDFGDGAVSNKPNVCHSYTFWSPEREYVVSLTVTDVDGDQNTYHNRIVVSNINIYMAISLIFAVGLVFVGSQWNEIKKRINA